MDVSMIATISAFLAPAVLAIFIARRQQAREEAAIEQYAARAPAVQADRPSTVPGE